MNKADKLAQELTDTCNGEKQSGCGQISTVFSSEANKEAEQTAVIARLSEEIIQAVQQKKEKRSRLEIARRAREECSPEHQNIEACMDAFVLVDRGSHLSGGTSHSRERCTARLNEHITTRTSAVALAEVEL